MKYIFILISIVLIQSCGLKKGNTNRAGENFPESTLTTLDGKVMDTREWSRGEAFLLFYFSTDCPHCQKELIEMKKESRLLEKRKILMVTWNRNFDEVNEYGKQSGYAELENVTIAVDSDRNLASHFSIRSFPFIVLYSKDRKFIKSFRGEIEPKVILSDKNSES
ncbi:TlpA family protein disulfide reductase [Pedobacter paludis]|uniref:Thioredoxin domain-containing protein n=1 Tax=Pedobacter paludis TaxID=2203212 RepID=A0A317F428_9SPHI|nr:redoxin family protein [Pedobacter paludis]PWS32236.1 hypothetical protein DF947_10735 [Pedobacter paludis]